MADLDLSISQHPDHCLVTARGSLDVTNLQQLDDCLAAAGRQATHLIVDLTEMTFIDTGSMGVLIQHWQRLARTDHLLVLVGATPANARALWVTGMAKHIPRSDSPTEALRILAENRLGTDSTPGR
ncbi:STAS domain-containing protein [Actinomadura rubrisoli]|uniref:STAS domain-containing protein n=1 Tax=Actinomadura rubrisoli TaxID=2530368 RepID=UPI0014054DBD|nr:STAS domain-containing protein [Actinomadura rubrisoli]